MSTLWGGDYSSCYHPRRPGPPGLTFSVPSNFRHELIDSFPEERGWWPRGSMLGSGLGAQQGCGLRGIPGPQSAIQQETQTQT